MLACATLLWGLFCYSDIELIFFYFLASLPDVQLVFGGRVALIAVTAMTAVLTIPAQKSKLKNVEVEVMVVERHDRPSAESMGWSVQLTVTLNSMTCPVEVVISGFLSRMRSFIGFSPKNQHSLLQTVQPC